MSYSVMSLEISKGIKQLFELGDSVLCAEFVEAVSSKLNLTQEQRAELLSTADLYATIAFSNYADEMLAKVNRKTKPEDIICP